MPFTGKATYSAGPTLPELVEDVGDVVGIVSPHETPLLDHLGDPQRVATSTVHEWLEDTLVPNIGYINDAANEGSTTATTFTVADGDAFRAGDLVRMDGYTKVMLITAVSGYDVTVTRGYGGTTAEALEDGALLLIFGNAALEGQDAQAARFTNRVRKQNYTQIFSATVEVSGSQQAATPAAVDDELDYQKQERLRELLRDLENCVINGVAPASGPEGSETTRRSMRGILSMLTTNTYHNGNAPLTEAYLNMALRFIWEQSNAAIDTIVGGGIQKRAINQFVASNRGYDADTTRFRDLVSVYESDFGVCRVLLSRNVPNDTAILLDSSRIAVLPLAGRSFGYLPLATTGDRVTGQVLGEYTLELRNEEAHGVIRGLSASG